MDGSRIPPPAEGPLGPYAKDIDPVAYALERVKTYVGWVEEHRASFEDLRAADPAAAGEELDNLADSSRQAQAHVARLVGLLLAGHTIDPAKRLPQEFARQAEPAAAAEGGGGSALPDSSLTRPSPRPGGVVRRRKGSPEG